ncbi:phosphate ABC transporter permease PstA [Methanothermobacter sp. KEPCO-1]|uniref:Phosphate transport system permease protein PstA n=1 Tax=Methanothermobacter marburgensis (strain ATCC BAA-927 / DSM 2133 / JCM 14651 / NBRC 100331 / OCM 82 / Marburg) TaxID=79929 RepID=D9PUL3_METTM|nr:MULTISPECIES: phosphate ABC transporter permease PstA [Methanothermobacter]ADL57911.1 predicted phosphate transport system permease protein [Methanothermobacter marburgensis str. Marburg]QEF94219.1 phosphate ABC transporter permease PstA [Methanothermobacter sp. KEPCO-1]WBF10114.1 phosphate ABC transporter permease PstA [Methanothermobacter marburgensis]
MSFRIISPKTSQKIMTGVLWASGLVTILILIVIIGYIILKGLPALTPEFLLSEPIDSGRAGGIAPMIVSSIYVTLIAGIIATPLGVGAAVYMAEYATEERIVKLIKFGAETLASIPSIVFGLFGLAFFVVFLGLGWSILSGGLVLALMALPTIFQVSQVSIETVPQSYREGSLALGATKWETIYRVVVPAALPGITTGVILGMARAISEAAAVMFVVGSALAMPISIFDPGRPLPLHLYIIATEGLSLKNAYGTAAVLVIIVLLITVLTNTLVDRYRRKMMGR